MGNIMSPRKGIGFLDILYGCYCIVLLPLSALGNTLGFLFYAAFYLVAASLLGLVLEYPLSLILALFPFCILIARKSYLRLESWLIGNVVARNALLLAHLIAGALCGRIVGIYLHRYATSTPLLTFEIIGMVIFVWINLNRFLARSNMTLTQCLSPWYIVP